MRKRLAYRTVNGRLGGRQMSIPKIQTPSVGGLAELLRGRPRALRAGEVASLLGVSERLVYKLASDRRIPAFRVGCALRFDPGALSSWLLHQMHSGGQAHLEESKWREVLGTARRRVVEKGASGQ